MPAAVRSRPISGPIWDRAEHRRMATFVVNKPIKTSESTIVVDGGLDAGLHRFMLVVETADGRRSAPMDITIDVIADVRQPVSPASTDVRASGLVTESVLPPAQPIRPSRPISPVRPTETPTRPVLRPMQPVEAPTKPSRPLAPSPSAPSPSTTAGPGNIVRPVQNEPSPSTPTRRPQGRKRPGDRDPQE
jgi:hypothetical protein